MNLISRNGDGDFCLVSVGMRQDSSYLVTVIYLYVCGSLRVQGGSWSFNYRQDAVRYARRTLLLKSKKKGYKPVELSELPALGYRYLKADLDDYVSEEEMLELVREASLERYVEFSCVLGIEDRFDEGLEYLAMKDEEDEGFYYVWDRYGKKCHCHDSRFDRLELTERAEKVRDSFPELMA